MFDSSGLLTGSVLFLVIGAIAVVLIRRVFARWRAKAGREDGYRKLAERSVAAETEIREDLLKLSESMADLQKRMISIEKVMREIE